MIKGPTSKKACQMLHEGYAQGHALTEKQRKMFGARCAGSPPKPARKSKRKSRRGR